MNIDIILGEIEKALCSGVKIEEKGIDRYIIHTDFTYPDGDELRIILKKQGDQWMLTDEGHTLMWLSYEELNINTDTRNNLLTRSLNSNHAELIDGRICIRFEHGKAGGAIHSMVQVLIQIADLIYTDREIIRSTFIEDMQAVFIGRLKEGTFETNKEMKNKKGEKYKVDVFIKGDEPVLIFAINNRDRCLDATLAMVTLATEDNIKFTSMVVIDDRAEIPQNYRDRAISRADKAYVGIEEMREGLPRFFEKNKCVET